MQLDEQEIQFKKKARRRLVGAIALVLLMVTVLPMILDDRSVNLPQQEIAITIPSQDSDDFTSNITPFIPEDPVPEGNEAVDGSSEAALVPESESTMPASPVSVPSPAAVKPEENPTKAVVPATSPPVASAPVPPAASQLQPTFLVQIGVFSDAANVKQLQEKLKAKGLSSNTEKIATPQGEKIRLRTGPYANRTLAEEALAKVRDAGLSGMIITNK